MVDRLNTVRRAPEEPEKRQALVAATRTAERMVIVVVDFLRRGGIATSNT